MTYAYPSYLVKRDYKEDYNPSKPKLASPHTANLRGLSRESGNTLCRDYVGIITPCSLVTTNE